MTVKYTGKIILIDRIRGFGFIECPKLGMNVFFSKGGTTVWDTLEIFVQVQFEKYTSTSPRHIGKPYAVHVVLLDKENGTIEGKYGPFKRWVAKLVEWNGQKGYLEVATLSKRIFLKHTTLAHCRIADVHQGDLFVVYPEKSINLLSDYFARFAYPIILETNADFLQEAWEKNDEKEIVDAIGERLRKTGHTDLLWRLQCHSMEGLREEEALHLIVGMIDKFKPWGYVPSLDDIDKVAGGNDSILLTLWLRGKTDHYKKNEVIDFFKTTSDKWRDQILGRLKTDEKINFLSEYVRHLGNKGELESNTPRLRYVLETAKRQGNEVKNSIIANLEIYLENLRESEKIELWTLGLFENLELGNMLSQLELKNTDLLISIIKKKSEEGKNHTKVILNHFLNKINRENFNEWYPYLIPVLRAAEKHWPELMNIKRHGLDKILSPVQIMTIGLFGVENYMKDDHDFTQVGGGKWPMYALVRYALIREKQKTITPEGIRQLLRQHGFSRERLVEEIPVIPWSQVLQPCRTQPSVDYEIGYLEDIKALCDVTELAEIRIFGEASLATHIFESVKAMQPFHARLWLNEYVPRSYYDYHGFREPFKHLTRTEKQLFVRPSQEMMEDIVDVQVISELLPCYAFHDDGNVRVYQAKLKNIHFKNGAFQLKIPGGLTHWREKEDVTYGLNFISGSHQLDTYIIEIHVGDNKIIHENGLDQLLSEIVRDNLKSSLLKKGGIIVNATENDEISYTDDLQLQEQILYYLKSLQDGDHEIIRVAPHMFDSGNLENNRSLMLSTRALTGLFTIKSNDAYVLVWEFYDLNYKNATYIFKVTFENYEKVVDRLTRLISTRSGVRAALSTLNTKKINQATLLEKFRRGVGYVSNFKIKRGAKGAFKLWERKLKEKIELQTPEFVDDAEWPEVLNNLELEDSRRTSILPGKRQRERSRSHKEDAHVETAAAEIESVFNPVEGSTVLSQGKEIVSKIRELNNLINAILK